MPVLAYVASTIILTDDVRAKAFEDEAVKVVVDGIVASTGDWQKVQSATVELRKSLQRRMGVS